MAQPYPGYETTIITRGELTDEAHDKLIERLTKSIQSFKGEVILQEDWGRRKLAYPIQKESRGRYTFLAYTGQPGVVQELERNLRIQEHVLRFLTVKLDDEFEKDAFLKQHVPFAQRIRTTPYRERGDRGDRGDRGERDFRDRDFRDRDYR